MSEINWNDGAVSTLTGGDTLTCANLKQGQLYAVFLYNSAGEDANIGVNVNIGNLYPPKTVTVPGTTGNMGLAALALVSGTDTQTVSISITSQQQGSKVTAWLGSVGMPTNTSGLNNQSLPFNGEQQHYDKCYRYYAVPKSQWYQLTLNSPVTQFISTQFTENYLNVFINNPVGDPATVIVPTGSVKEGAPGLGSYQIVKSDSTPQTITYQDQGNGQQKVWMNADSGQNSNNSSIAAQYM
ncbi:hypothetical protein LZP73_16850 [Shewanella sp. AS16]|uniref:hypothetical protein n=1 Tax=Shewanella sp. AS16 TaxID=2907625 RepID=UPI001F1B175A|nr:hypothetical protein [Shewanella sp. AS16]MCE9687851.1 hypothetical protein [Shewanella sp. AS16]